MTVQIRLVGPHDEVERARKHINQMSGKKIWSGPYKEHYGRGGEMVFCIVDPSRDCINRS